MTNWENRSTPVTLSDRTALDHDMYGVEVEVEYNNIMGFNIPNALADFWSAVNDGSLRTYGKTGDYAHEFRYTKPLNILTSAIAVKKLCQVINSKASEIYNSGRTSTHVHVNICNINMLQIMNLITLSIIFDELLVSQHHPFRKGNLFALRFIDAEWPIRHLVANVNRPSFRHFSTGNTFRYASVNLTSIARFGTIEYRSLDGELDATRINNWVFCLHQLKKLATGYKNPREIVENFNQVGPVAFMREHIPDYYHVSQSKATEMLSRGAILAADLAYASDWVSKTEEYPIVRKLKTNQILFNELMDHHILSSMASPPVSGPLPPAPMPSLGPTQGASSINTNTSPIEYIIPLNWGQYDDPQN